MIITFPQREQLTCSSSGVGYKQIIFGKMAEYIGMFMLKFGIPAGIRSCNIKDEYTGQRIDIQSGVLSTRVSINGRDYYFDRFTGRHTGTGLGCS